MSRATLQTILSDAETWTDEDRQELADYARVIEARRSGLYKVSDSERVAIGEALQQADRAECLSPSELIDFKNREA